MTGDFEISREYWFSAAHRIEGHPKCGRLHGHNYKVVVVLGADRLADGMVLDYGILDSIVKPIIETLDHRYLVSDSNLMNRDLYALISLQDGRQDGVRLPIEFSTAECLAKYLFHEILGKFVKGFTVSYIEIWETPKSVARYYGETANVA